MNRKQKLKKYFKENWLLYFFLVVSLVVGFYGLFNSKHKTTNKLVESEVKQAEVLRRKDALPTYIELAFSLNPLYNTSILFIDNIDTGNEQIDYFTAGDNLYTLYETQLLEETIYDLQPNNLILLFNCGSNLIESYKYTFYCSYISKLTTYTTNNYGSRVIAEDFIVPLNTINYPITPTKNYNYVEITLIDNNFNNRRLLSVSPYNNNTLNNNYNELLNNYNNLLNETTNKINELTARVVSQYQTIQQLQATIDASSSLVPVVNTAISTPFNMIHNMLNFDIFGINLYAILSFICTLCLVFFIIKKLL